MWQPLHGPLCGGGGSGGPTTELLRVLGFWVKSVRKMVTRSLIDCELLISEVEKRPALYNFQLKEYNDKNLKEKLWTEVCEALVRGWHDLSPGEKNDTGMPL